MASSTKSPAAEERAKSHALGVVGEKSTSTATGEAFGCAPACPVQRKAARGSTRPAFLSSVEEREIAPHRYTLLTDALSSDDESCTEWQAMKAELSDWNITTKNKSSKKRKKRRKKKKGAQTVSCPDQFDEENVKLDPKQVQQDVEEPSPTVNRSRTISAGSRSSGSYYDAETSPVSIPNSYAGDSEETISAESSSSYYDAENSSFTDSGCITSAKQKTSSCPTFKSSLTPAALKQTATESTSKETDSVSISPVSNTENSPLNSSSMKNLTLESSASNISPTGALSKPRHSSVSPSSNRPRIPLRRATTRLPLNIPLKPPPPQVSCNPTTALPKSGNLLVSPCSPSECAKTHATVRGSPLPDQPQQDAIKLSPSPPSHSSFCERHSSSSMAPTPAQHQSPADSQLNLEDVNKIAHFAALKRVCNSSLRVPPILCHDIYPKTPPVPYKVSKNCPVPYPIRGVNIDGCVPSKYICQEHILPVKEVLAKYSYLIKKDARLIHICKLCIKLAKESIFGVSIMMMCSTSEKGFLFGLPYPELWLLKRIVLEQYTQYWNRLRDFEKVWKWCMKALRKTCRTERLRISEGCTEEDLYRLSCSCQCSP